MSNKIDNLLKKDTEGHEEIINLNAEPLEPFLKTIHKREKIRGGLSWLLSGTLCFTVAFKYWNLIILGVLRSIHQFSVN